MQSRERVRLAWGGRHGQREMKVALRRGNEEKSRNQTSDQEKESVQRKWVGRALREESPTACCFLSSQRTGWDWLVNCSLVICASADLAEDVKVPEHRA